MWGLKPRPSKFLSAQSHGGAMDFFFIALIFDWSTVMGLFEISVEGWNVYRTSVHRKAGRNLNDLGFKVALTMKCCPIYVKKPFPFYFFKIISNSEFSIFGQNHWTKFGWALFLMIDIENEAFSDYVRMYDLIKTNTLWLESSLCIKRFIIYLTLQIGREPAMTLCCWYLLHIW